MRAGPARRLSQRRPAFGLSAFIASRLSERGKTGVLSSRSRNEVPRSDEPAFASRANFIFVSLFDVMNAFERNNLSKSLEA
jgi:hypothetical protein